MADQYDFDVVILGSGPGGYVAAIRAAQLGLKPVLIEKDKPGGVCLNIGCIPSKALIHQAELLGCVGELEAMGARVDVAGLDYARVQAASRAAADKLSKGVQFLIKKNNVEFIAGCGRLAGPHEVAVDGGRTVTGKFIIVATGSRPREIPGMAFDEQTVLSSTGLLMMRALPKSLLVLGSGYIGMEFAYVMNAFGVDVHVVEMLDRILPLADAEVVTVVRRAFEKRGVKFSTSTRAVGLRLTDAGADVTLQGPDGQTQVASAEKVLVAVGRAPNTEAIGLETVGIETDEGFVPAGDYYRTSAPSVYAIGDVTRSPLLAHVASKAGEIAVEHMAGRTPREKKIDPLGIPSAAYFQPQMASFGYTEQAAEQAGVAYAKASFPYRASGKAVAVGQVEGVVKLLFDTETREILGAHVVGAEATELIHELLLARTGELVCEDVATMIHAHPTLSEIVMEAARAAEGWAIHM